MAFIEANTMKTKILNGRTERWTAAVLFAAVSASMVAGQNAPPGGAPKATPYTLSGTYSLGGKTDKTVLQNYKSDTKDVSAIFVKGGGDLSLAEPVITTTGDTSSDDNSSFYGLNAALLATKGGRVKVTDGSVTTSGTGGNAVFSTGSGTTVSLSKTKISTTGDGAHGLMATAGGKLTADDADLTTTGTHAAAVATDRGGGTIIVTGGNFNTSGDKSPAIYSTGVVKITGATMIATGAEAAVVEGRNSIILADTKLTGQKSRGVMIYQSSSGDSQGGTGTFAMKGGSLIAGDGPLFYITNTTATIFTTGVTFNASSGKLIDASGGEWGKTGFNGGKVTFTGDQEILSGDITADNISSIAVKLENKTTLTGTVKNAAVTMDSSSIWNVSDDSTVTSFADAGISGTNVLNVVGNGHNVHYDSTLSANYSLGGRRYNLLSGGRLLPTKSNGNDNNDNGRNNGYGNGIGAGRGGGGGGGRR
jgi:hypothetical protein